MRFFELLESSYEDVLRPEVVNFIEENKSFYTELFVTFSESTTPSSSGLGVNVIPLMQFVKRPMEYRDLINTHNLIVLDITTPILYINKVDRKQFMRLMNALNVDDIQKAYKTIVDEQGYSNKSNSYGLVLNYSLKHNILDGVVTGTQLSKQEYIDNIQTLGYTAIVDSSVSINNNILSNEYTSIGYMFKNASFNITNVIGFDTVDETIVQDDDDILHNLAKHIAVGLNTGLNHDDPYHQGLDHYYWTFDGMQIRITETFKKSDDKSNSTAYILDIETPYGILYHMTNADDSHDDIEKDIMSRYTRMSEPLSNWKPMDRDVFLMNNTLDYKDNEQKLEDVIKEVQKYYNEMRDFGIRYKIILQPEKYYSEFDLSFISGIMDRFAQNQSATTFINKISDKGEITDMRVLDDYFPRQRLPRKMDYNELKKMAKVYDIAKKLQPKKSGWRVFHSYH